MQSRAKIMALVACLVCSAIAVGGGFASQSRASSDQTDLLSLVRPEWSVSIDLVGSPAVAGDTVVSYVDSGDGNLEIVAWDAASGRELWRDSAVTGGAPERTALGATVVSVGGAKLVAYLRDLDSDTIGWQVFVAADPRTGRKVPISNDIVYANELPAECADTRGICFQGWLDGAGDHPSAYFRLDPATNTLVADAATYVPHDAFALSDHLYSVDGSTDGQPEALGYGAHGHEVWRRPYAEVFASGYSIEGGWSWFDRPTLGALVGTGSSYSDDRDRATTADYPLADDMTVALDPATGATRWKHDSANTWCAAALTSVDLLHSIVPLCRIESGVMAVDRTDPHDVSIVAHDLRVTLVGVRVQTGEVAWSLDLGGDDSVLWSKDGAFSSRLAVRPVDIDGRLTLVDSLTGATASAPAHSRYACERSRDDYLGRYNDDTVHESRAFYAGRGVYPCAADRAQIGGSALSPTAVRMAGQPAGGGRYLVAGLNNLAVYRVGD